jgi:hypothetical protein
MRKWATSGVVVFLALVVGVWLLLDRDGDQPGGSDLLTGKGAQPWRQMVQDGLKGIRVKGLPEKWPFSAVQATSTGMSPRLRREARDVLGAPEPLRLRFEEARYARTPTDIGLWVVFGRGVTCMFRAVRMASTCSPTVDVYRRGMLLQTYKTASPGGRPIQFAALGIVPDGVRSVAATVEGEPRNIPVVDNAFADVAKTPIRIIDLNR